MDLINIGIKINGKSYLFIVQPDTKGNYVFYAINKKNMSEVSSSYIISKTDLINVNSGKIIEKKVEEIRAKIIEELKNKED